MKALPNAMRSASASNNWAVNGPLTASGQALMAGDPHLNLTLPSIWYQLAGSSPGYIFSGVSVPGVPLILIGRNQQISWSMTDVQNASTLFCREKTDRAHPNQYYWDGAWRQMQHIVYTIPVKGHATVHQDISLTVHGPILLADQGLTGETLAVDWMGALPSTDSEALMDMFKAANVSQFKDALSRWNAPTLNFVYADDQGNIGMISPGYYPIVKAGAPWLPLPGTGEADRSGSIPYSAVPQVYDPASHMVLSANQRPVSNSYPYYIGTTWNSFDNGYRASEIYSELQSKTQLTIHDMEHMQSSTHDYLAGLMVPALLKTLQQSTLSQSEQEAEALLRNWNGDMDANAPAALIWWTFWTHYLTDVFGPWWRAAHVPVKAHPELAVGPDQSSLDEDLETWTLSDPTNAVFTLPTGAKRNASVVMRQAFNETVSELGKTLGSNPKQWQWGRLHTRKIVSQPGVDALSYGPQASGGDEWTLLAAGDHPLSATNPTLTPSIHGPGRRIIIDWGTGQTEGTYPGGQDENPASPWYENQISHWWNGQYYPMIDGATAHRQSDSVVWMPGK
ncbi:MAG TPA: penicillin acylase family protein [Ktedonobacteraceae bacterium]